MAAADDALAAALSAVAAATAPPTPTPLPLPLPMSPQIKYEPTTGDATILESEPPRSPLKRSRSPHTDHADEEHRDGKRFKAEPDGDENLDEIARLVQQAEKTEPNGGDNLDDEIARLVQQAEASSMQQFHTAVESEPTSEPAPEPVPQPEPEAEYYQTNDVFESTEQSHIDSAVEAVLQAALEQRTSPIEDPQPQTDTLWSNPRDFTRRKHIIPALGSLAIDILVALSEQPFEDTIATFTGDPDVEICSEYNSLRSAFDVQRRQLSELSEEQWLLNPVQLGLAGQAKEIIRIANLATACASMFGTNEMTLEDINTHFMSIFVPKGEELPRDTAELYLGLKTQVFLGTVEGDRHQNVRESLLEELFVAGLENALQGHHPHTPLTISELNFLADAKTRKTMLLNASSSAEAINQTGKQFAWEAYLDSLSTYLNDHIEIIKSQGSGKVEVNARAESVAPENDMTHGADAAFDLDAAVAEASRIAESYTVPNSEEHTGYDDLSAFMAGEVAKAVEQAKEVSLETGMPPGLVSENESASRATMLALKSIQQNQYQPTALAQSSSHAQSTSSSHNSYQQQQRQTHTQQQYYSYQQQPAANTQPSYRAPSDQLPPNQTDSTAVLYERARQAAAARSSTHARREGSHSTRRPWSPEEEKALMVGLDTVKGPHWSQILQLFGPNGTTSNILADRTQVQLKDKARNLKLFFLKTNSEMPYYLHSVTGELKTRAPTQAARKEAEEKAKTNSEEHQAHMNGIMTLAGGLHNNAPSRPSPLATAPRSGTPNQPLSHHGSQPGTPRISQLPTAIPASRPVIPAPQPVSLPNLVSAAHHHTQPGPAPKLEQQAEHKSEHQPDSVAAPVAQSIRPDHPEMSSEDAALLGLKAAMEVELASLSAPEEPVLKLEESPTENGGILT